MEGMNKKRMQSTDSCDSVKSTPSIEVIDLDSDVEIIEVVETSTPTSSASPFSSSLLDVQLVTDPDLLNPLPDAQPLLPESMEPPAKKRCLDCEEDAISDSDWVIDHYQIVTEITDFPTYKFSDIRKFWLSETVAFALQTNEGELCAHIRQYDSHHFYEWLPTLKGAMLDMFTFFELCNKLPTFSKTLAHTGESCILNSCLMVIIKDHHMHLRRFNDVRLHPHEIVLTVKMFRNLCDQLSDIIDFVLDYQFNTLLKTQVCLPYDPLPTTDNAFYELKKIVRDSMQEGIQFAFICPDCVSGVTTMVFHECRRLTYSEKFTELPYYTPILVKVSQVAREYLSYNSKLNFTNYDFTRLYKNMY